MQAVPSCAPGRLRQSRRAGPCDSCPAGHPFKSIVARARRQQHRLAVRASARDTSSRATQSVRPPPAAAAAGGLTERIFRLMEQKNSSGEQALGAGGATSYEALKRADAAWKSLRTRKVWGPPPQFVRTTQDRLGAAADVDVVVCGGTLGIFLACALQLKGLRVAVVERGPLQGRAQEWNISKKELRELVELGVLSEQDALESISVEFNPVRVGFHVDVKGKKGASCTTSTSELWTTDVLNLGVSPARLIAAAQRRFEEAGGQLLDRTPLDGVWVHPDGVSLQLGGGGGGGGSAPQQAGQQQRRPRRQLTAKLLLDGMGHASPIVQQVRWGQKPDGVCLVVGTCTRGFDSNTTGDVIFTTSHSQPPAAATAARYGAGASSGSSAADSHPVHNTQYFWEAFPAGSGPKDRTTYLFSYMDAQPDRPSLEAMLEDYWKLMPQYQKVALGDLEVLRILFGWFPTYRGSPLRPQWDRVLQVGDASGIQSPLSFGGFGALTRHLRRLTDAVEEAIAVDMLDSSSLALINAYNPGLSGAWMLQRAMSIPSDAGSYNPAFINRLLAANFRAMEDLGDPTLKPFLQDVIQLKPLAQTLGKQLLSDPLMVPQILMRVGPAAMADWLLHFLGLASYTFLHWDAQKYVPLIEKLPPRSRFLMHRALDNWKYGSGKDFTL